MIPSAKDNFAFVQFDDPNEALGLAVRLVGATAPFDRLPLGLSTGLLAHLIDRREYGFARRGDLATGFVAFGFVEDSAANAFLRGARRLFPGDLRPRGAGTGLVFAFRGVDRATTQFLVERLRDVVFRETEAVRYIRDYGDGAAKPPRLVTLRRRRPGAAG